MPVKAQGPRKKLCQGPESVLTSVMDVMLGFLSDLVEGPKSVL